MASSQSLGKPRGVKTAEMIEFEKGPKYLQMNFGPALFWTLQVETRAVDVLLDQLPWGLSMIRTPWMHAMLNVDWR